MVGSDPLLAASASGPGPAPQLLAAGMAATAPATALANMAAASGAPQDKLTPAVGSRGWDQALGQRVVWMVNGAEQSASLSLNPPDLGPLQVVLNVSQGQATASFTAAQPEVRQALEAAMPRLRDMLADAGINLGQTSVGAGTTQQQQQQQSSFAQHAASQRDSVQNRTDSDARIGAMDRIATPARRAGRDGMVDTFA